MVHKWIHAGHTGVDLKMAAVIHMQLHHNIAAGSIQLLAADIFKIILGTGFSELGNNKAVLIIENAKAHIVCHQRNAAQYQETAAAQQQPVLFVAAHEGCRNTQCKHNDADGAIALAEPHGLTAAVLHLAPKYFCKPFIHQVAETKNHCHH